MREVRYRNDFQKQSTTNTEYLEHRAELFPILSVVSSKAMPKKRLSEDPTKDPPTLPGVAHADLYDSLPNLAKDVHAPKVDIAQNQGQAVSVCYLIYDEIYGELRCMLKACSTSHQSSEILLKRYCGLMSWRR